MNCRIEVRKNSSHFCFSLVLFLQPSFLVVNKYGGDRLGAEEFSKAPFLIMQEMDIGLLP